MVCPGIQKLPKETAASGRNIEKVYRKQSPWRLQEMRCRHFHRKNCWRLFEKEGISVLPLKGILMKRFLSGYKYADDGGSGYFCMRREEEKKWKRF